MKPEWRIDKHSNEWYSWYVLEHYHPYKQWAGNEGYALVLHFGAVHDWKWLCTHCLKEPPKDWVVAYYLLTMQR
jgi:hypothetical protein